MSNTIKACDYKTWELYGLKTFDNFAESVQFFNQETDFGDTTQGEWFYEETNHKAPDGTIYHLIYGGTFGNYNSPGSSHHTWCEVYEVNELKEFNARVAELETMDEYLDDEQYDDSDNEEEDEDYDDFTMCNPN